MKNEKPKFDAKIAWYDETCKCLDLDLWSIIQSQCQNGAFITSKYNVMAYKWLYEYIERSATSLTSFRALYEYRWNSVNFI